MCFCHNDCALIESLLLSLLLQPLGTMPKSWLTLSKSVACLLKMFVHNKHSKWLNLWKIKFSTFGLYVCDWTYERLAFLLLVSTVKKSKWLVEKQRHFHFLWHSQSKVFSISQKKNHTRQQ
jgi:hypothetical protein